MEEKVFGEVVVKILKGMHQSGERASNQSLLTRIRQNPFRYVVILLCLVNIILAIVNVGLWVSAAYQKLFVAADFTSFYTGYYMVRIGEGANLYDPSLQSQYQQQFMGGLSFEGGVLLFPNPPYVAVALSPLSLFPLNSAFYLWTMIQLAILIWILINLNHLFSHWNAQERLILMITILAFWPLTYTFLLGQFSLLLLLGFMQMFISMRIMKLTKAGLWMSLLAIKPHVLLIPGMLSLNRRYLRIALAAVVVAVFLFITTTSVIGLRPWADYIHSLQALGSYFGEFGVHPITEYTLRGVLSNILGSSQGSLTNLISIIFLLVGMVFTWWLWSKLNYPDSSRLTLYFAFTVLLSIFFSLHLNPHDSLILVLPAALFYDTLRNQDHPIKIYTFIVLISPLVFLVTAFTNFSFLGVLRLPVIIILIILAWMGKYLFIEYRAGSKAIVNEAMESRGT